MLAARHKYLKCPEGDNAKVHREKNGTDAKGLCDKKSIEESSFVELGKTKVGAAARKIIRKRRSYQNEREIQE